MGEPAAVMGDMITGACPQHVLPAPSAAPLPFSAPLRQGLATTVLIGGRAGAVVGSSGVCTPPHVGLAPADPFFTPTLQVGRVVSGSATVFFEGKPAAKTASSATCCVVPATPLVGSAVNVLIG